MPEFDVQVAIPMPRAKGASVVSAGANFTRKDVLEALASWDKDTVVGALTQVGDAGEMAAVTMNYGDHVARLMGHHEPEVAGAAASALGGMGSVGARFAEYISQMQMHPHPLCRASAVEALGRLGPLAENYAEVLKGSALADSEAVVRALAVTALGETGAYGYSEFFASLVDDPNPEIAAAAIEALGKNGAAAEARADEIVTKLSNGRTRYAALSAIAKMGDQAPSTCGPKIVACLADKDLLTRNLAVEAILAGVPAPMEKIADLLQGSSVSGKCAAATTLGGMGEKASVHAAAIAGLLDDPVEDVSGLALQMGGGGRRATPSMRIPKASAAIALGKMKSTEYMDKIGELLGHESWEIRVSALEAFGMIGTAAADRSSLVTALLEDGTFPVRAKAAETLGIMQDEGAVEALGFLLKDKAFSVRVSAVTALGAIGESASQSSHEIFKLTQDPNNMVRSAAIKALSCLGETGQNYASVVATMLYDEDPAIRIAVVEALGDMGSFGKAYDEEISALLRDPVVAVQEAATKVLVLQGKLELKDSPFEALPAIGQAPAAGKDMGAADFGLAGLGDYFKLSMEKLNEISST